MISTHLKLVVQGTEHIHVRVHKNGLCDVTMQGKPFKANLYTALERIPNKDVTLEVLAPTNGLNDSRLANLVASAKSINLESRRENAYGQVIQVDKLCNQFKVFNTEKLVVSWPVQPNFVTTASFPKLERIEISSGRGRVEHTRLDLLLPSHWWSAEWYSKIRKLTTFHMIDIRLAKHFTSLEHATIEDLVRAREARGGIRPRPRGYPRNAGEGLTYLGQAIGRRRDLNRQADINEQLRQLDPTGEIVAALMGGRR